MKTEKTYIAILLLLLLYSILSCKPAVNTTTITLSERVEQPAMPLLTQKKTYFARFHQMKSIRKFQL